MDTWSKGGYSQHIREVSMAMEGLPEVVPPSGRVPGQLLLAAPILKWRRRYKEEMGKGTSILGVSFTGAKYRRMGAPRGSTRDPGGSLARPPRAAPPGRQEPWWVPCFPLLVIPEASGTLIFYIIFLEFLGHLKYRENLKYKNSRKRELALGCTELIG